MQKTILETKAAELKLEEEKLQADIESSKIRKQAAEDGLKSAEKAISTLKSLEASIPAEVPFQKNSFTIFKLPVQDAIQSGVPRPLP